MLSKNNTYLNYKIYLFFLDIIIIFLSFYFSLILNNYAFIENYGYLIVIYVFSFLLFIYFDNYKYKSLRFIRSYLLNNVLINIIIFGFITFMIFITPLGDKVKFINIFKFYFLFYFAGIIFLRIIIFENAFKKVNKIRSFNRNAVILGVNEESASLYENKEVLRLNNGLNIIGFLKIRTTYNKFSYKHAILGKYQDILELSVKYNFKNVFILNNNIETDELINMIEFLRTNNFMVCVSEKNLKCLFN